VTRLTGGTVVKGDEVAADSAGDNNTRTACPGDVTAVQRWRRRDGGTGSGGIRTFLRVQTYYTVPTLR